MVLGGECAAPICVLWIKAERENAGSQLLAALQSGTAPASQHEASNGALCARCCSPSGTGLWSMKPEDVPSLIKLHKQVVKFWLSADATSNIF
jgi:hypothetical protein